MSSLPTTRWSLLRLSAEQGEAGRAAWTGLLGDYRSVVLGFFRRSPLRAEAEDLCQQFILESIAEGWWSRAEPEAGSFRRFLFVLLHRFLVKEMNRAQRRQETLGEELLPTLAAEPSPDDDLNFLLALTSAALVQLQADYRRRQREPLFLALRPQLVEPGEHGELAELADRLGMKRNTLLVELARLRSRLRAQMQSQLTDLCSDPAQGLAEWQNLQAVLRG